MMKHILILGAGLMQKPAILSAKELGYHTVVVDGNPHAVCVPFADDFRPVDLKDRETIAAIALELMHNDGLEAVFTAGTDFSASVAYVVEKCGLQGHSFEACLNASIKTRMRQCFEKHGVPSPHFVDIHTENVSEVISHIQCNEYPLVIKPVDNMGARGCRLIRDKREEQYAIDVAMKSSRTNHAILEDYMEGPEFSIDSLVYDGTMTITGFADRHIFYPPYFIEVGHTMPTNCSREMYLELVATFALGVKALGLTRGAAKADIKYTKNGPMIGEIAARLSGGYMSGWTYPYASECNLTKQALLIACGQRPEELETRRVALPYTPPASCAKMEQPFELYDLTCVATSAERAWISIPGVIRTIYGMEDAKKVHGVKNILPRSKEGDSVVFPRNNVEKGGNVITCLPDREDAIAAAEKAVQTIVLRLAPHCEATDDFLSGKIEAYEEGFPPAAYPGISVPSDIQTKIPADTPIFDYLPKQFADLKIKDWNYNTISETVLLFDKIAPCHPALDASVFWHAVLRGGIQGALYVLDSQ
ncbi:MAG: ATP-grasp domain-containing protein [Treponema sp.]|nr:ATP-grasp domain-containing protein [Treponema sp.]